MLPDGPHEQSHRPPVISRRAGPAIFPCCARTGLFWSGRHPAKHHPRRTGPGACIPILRAAPGRFRDGAAGAHDDVRKSTHPNEARTEILSVRRTCKASWSPAPGANGRQKLLGLSDKTATLFQRPLEDGLLPRPAASGVPHPHRSALRPFSRSSHAGSEARRKLTGVRGMPPNLAAATEPSTCFTRWTSVIRSIDGRDE